MTNTELFFFTSSILLLGFSFSIILALTRRVIYFKSVIEKRRAFMDKVLELIADKENVDVERYLTLAIDELERR